MNYIEELEREKAHSDAMSAAALMWMEKAKALERMIFALVHAAGGRINVPLETMHMLPRLELVMSEDPSNYLLEFRTQLRSR